MVVEKALGYNQLQTGASNAALSLVIIFQHKCFIPYVTSHHNNATIIY